MLHVASVTLLLALAHGSALANEGSECPNWYGSSHCQCGLALRCGIINFVLMMECISVLTTPEQSHIQSRCQKMKGGEFHTMDMLWLF